MRSTNNKYQTESSDSTFWVVYDDHTEEYLTFYDGASEFDKGSEWKRLLIEEGIDGNIADIEPSARFDSEEEAQDAADRIAEEISIDHPDDDILLHIRRISVENVEMVCHFDTLGAVRRPGSVDEEEDWDTAAGDGFEQSEEDEEEEDEEEVFRRDPYPGRTLDLVDEPTPAPKKAKRAKKRKSTRKG